MKRNALLGIVVVSLLSCAEGPVYFADVRDKEANRKYDPNPALLRGEPFSCVVQL